MQLDVPQPQESLIKGDARSISIARQYYCKSNKDRLMEEYDELYPGYGFKNNAAMEQRTSSRVRKIRCNTHSSTYVCANKRYDLKIKHFLRILILRRCERGVFVEILQRQLLFKLAVCQGIGNLGILKVLQSYRTKAC